MQYVENSQQITDLHNQMKECDGVLARYLIIIIITTITIIM